MKFQKLLFLIVLLVSLLFTGTSLAHDTDLYTSSGAGVEPNILIIFDNSGSMDQEVQAYFYDKTITYTPQTYSPNAVYYSSYYGGWTLFKDSISLVPCASAQTTLTNNGHYEGYTSSSCSSSYYSLRTGNFRNYLASVGGSEYLPKLTIAKRVIRDFIDTINGVRVGVMIFNYSEGGHIQSFITSLTDTTRTQLKTDIDSIDADTWTPLGETLYEAGRYFKGGSSYFNSGVVYTSPIQYHCQRNYVILITDGEPTKDKNSVLKDGATVSGTVYPKIGDQDGDKREPGMVNAPTYSDDGSDYLDDVAKYYYETDLRSDLTGQQNIITYTIGFNISSSLLERTAMHGHGRYYYSQNAQDLANVFQNIVGEILAKSTSFVAPIVPVSRLERTTAGDKIYLAFFKPVQNAMWKGNIKKYGVQQTDDSVAGINKGDIIDSNSQEALDSNGQFYSTARSFWTTAAMDGGEVEQGGVGEVLMYRTTSRNIYTYFYSNADLTHSSNAFTTSNASITPTVLGLLAGDTVAKDKVINFVRGFDAYDDNGNGNTTEKRDWILGSFLHSRPLIIHYSSTRSVIFAGSNGGMLHAFDDSDGRELWGFIPPNVLNKLQALHADVIENYVDGSPRAYLSYHPTTGALTQAILIFGQRRGGNRYYALDVTNPDAPQFLWEIGPGSPSRVYQTTSYTTTDYQEMGQTWAAPIIGKIAYGTGEKWVVFIGGGFDTNNDNDPVTAADSIGRAIFVVDVLNGALVKRFSYAEKPEMTYAIPSDIARVDTDGNGKVDRLYAGDLGGRIWRCDIGDSDVSQWTAKIIFKSNPGASDHRKIFYAPDVTLEKDSTGNYEMLFIGTGDRENPKESTVINRLYAVKDKNPTTPLVEDTDLVNVTEGVTDIGELSTKSGWYILLENLSEKCLAAPVVFYKAVYFTTFSATSEGVTGDPCYVGEGTARLYVVRYNTGNAVFNFDLTNDVGETVLGKSDRSLIMGTAIPSGVIITFIGGTAVAYTGVGGGVYAPELVSTKSLVPLTWRIVF